MLTNRKVVKVFLASPGDLTDERKAAKDIVEEFNSLNADAFGYQVELVGWEDTVSGYGRPQEVINRELARCELVIGVLWMRWGTPPSIKGAYTSGFEEEFETSIQRRESEGKPQVALFFKEIDPAFLRDPGAQLTTVVNFQKRIQDEKKILYEKFSDIRDFEKKVRRCITKFVEQLRSQETREDLEQQVPPTKALGVQTEEQNDVGSNAPLQKEGRQFLQSLITKAEFPSSEPPLSSAEVARFRLLAGLVGTHGNDDQPLGVHDANLIFVNKESFHFGRQELSGLSTSGLEHYSSENAPLWYWIRAVDGFRDDLISIYSIIGSSPVRKIAALQAMTLIEAPLPSNAVFNRRSFLNAWFEKDSVDSVKISALTYLGTCGITSDAIFIRELLQSESNQIIDAASEAVVRIALRDSREKAFDALLELQPSAISKDTLREIFENDAAFSTDMLKTGLSHPNSEVRWEIIRLLRKRKQYTVELAEPSLTDNDVRVRYEALDSLIEAGRNFSVDEGKEILVKKTENGILGLLSASEMLVSNYLDRFKQRRLSALTDKELEIIALEESIFDQQVLFVLARRHPKKYGPLLRDAVDDQFRSVFEKSIQRLADRFGSETDLISGIRELELPVRKKLTRKGLDVICERADSRDLLQVRKVLKTGSIDFSTTDIDYLGKCGEWEDISLIVQLIQKPNSEALTLFSSTNSSSLRAARKALYALGKNRLRELVEMPMPSKLQAQLVAEVPDRRFNTIYGDWILPMLRSEDERLRKIVAVKCIKSLPKQTIVKLLAEYLAKEGTYYYNVVHWLDFGISTPKHAVLLAADKILNS